MGSSGDLIGSPRSWRESPSSGVGHFPLTQLQRFGCRLDFVNNNKKRANPPNLSSTSQGVEITVLAPAISPVRVNPSNPAPSYASLVPLEQHFMTTEAAGTGSPAICDVVLNSGRPPNITPINTAYCYPTARSPAQRKGYQRARRLSGGPSERSPADCHG